MMNKERAWKGIVITILALNFLLIASTFFTLKKPQPTMQLSVNQRIVLECQKLAANYPPKDWSYKSCVENVRDADHIEARILKTI